MLHRIAQDFKHRLGYPEAVYMTLTRHPSIVGMLPPMPMSCSYSHSVCAWHLWINTASLRTQQSRELASMISSFFVITDTSDVEINIRQIAGLSSSKSPLSECVTLDQFAETHCHSFLETCSESNVDSLLASVLSHGSYRLYRFSWDDRIFLFNSDGSHRFAAARYIASESARVFTSRFPMTSVSIDRVRVNDFRALYAAYVIDTEDAEAVLSLFQAFRAVNAPYFVLRLPVPYNSYEVCFFPRSSTRALAVADALFENRAQDFGEFLEGLTGGRSR